VVYGDIGTSPLIVFAAIFSNPPTDPRDVYGALSLIIWSMTIVVLIKYIFIVLRADDNGEGGTFALYSLLSRNDSISASESQKHPNFIKRSIAVQTILFGVVIFGSSLVMSDGLLTPAISVISAVEGIAVPMPSLAPAIVPLSCFIIVVLFLSQRFGTDKVGSLYAPSISLWFIAITSIGIWNISQYPEIFKAYNPYHAFDYFIRKKDTGFTDLGGIFLAITGVEALFADLGHFNKKAIQISFPFCVFIPLVLVYTGQAARLVLDPTIVSNTFWLTTPSHPGIYWIVFILAVSATIISSQAMITGTFSLIYQSMQLDCFPKVKVIHTSEKVEGQIYIPESCLVPAYGVAVASVMIITTILLTIVIRVVWRLPIIVSVIFFCIFFIVDASFLGANLKKIESGGWFTLCIAAFLTIMMYIWRWGTVRVLHHERSQSPDLSEIFKDKNVSTDNNMEISFPEIALENNNATILGSGNENDSIVSKTHLTRSPGISLFYSDIGTNIPLSFIQFVKHFSIIPQNVIFITIRTVGDPKVGDNDRLKVKKIKNYEDCYQVTARYGYSEQISQRREFLLQLVESIRKIDPNNKILAKDFDPDSSLVTYVVGQHYLCSTHNSPWWIKILINVYTFIYFNSRKFYSNWDIPVDSIVVVGVNIPI
ncbi:23185_t:CDS:10, partial [Cetraspora pellucida]